MEYTEDIDELLLRLNGRVRYKPLNVNKILDLCILLL